MKIAGAYGIPAQGCYPHTSSLVSMVAAAEAANQVQRTPHNQQQPCSEALLVTVTWVKDKQGG